MEVNKSVRIGYTDSAVDVSVPDSGYRLAVVGSRSVTSVDLSEFVSVLPAVVVSGGAKGADSIAAVWGHSIGAKVVEYYPDYNRYGRSAPLVRNKSIVENCDAVLALWDGSSRGTMHTVRYARKLGIPVAVVMVAASE